MPNESAIRHRLSRPDGAFEVIVLDRGDDQLNPPCAAVFGQPADDCLVRIQSRCVYGEIFGADTCDCRAQLDRSIERIKAEGSGVLVYLDQEGRGSGLAAKAKGYQLTDQLQLDTFASYAHLGLAPDSRSFADAATLLAQLELRRVRLLTNNPDKVAALETAGLVVKRETLLTDAPSEYAFNYLLAKEEHGHRFVQS